MGASAIFLILLLVFLGAGVLRTQSASKSVTSLLIWAFIIVALVFGYNQYERIRFAPREVGGNTVITVPIHNIHNGFVIDVALNGTNLEALIDTGASAIVLSYDDAKAIGIDVTALSFDQPVSTANGTTFHAHARLDSLRIGDLEVLQNERILVAGEDELDITLLGMTFLQKTAGYEVANNLMRLTF